MPKRTTWNSIQSQFVRDRNGPIVHGYHCFLWTGGTGHNGYGYVNISGRRWRIHRYVWTHYHGPIPQGLQIRHHCDVRHCGEIHHLAFGTSQDDANDRVARGRTWHPPHVYGDLNPRTKIKARMRERIRTVHRKTGLSERALAQIFGISRTSIHNALNVAEVE